MKWTLANGMNKRRLFMYGSTLHYTTAVFSKYHLFPTYGKIKKTQQRRPWDVFPTWFIFCYRNNHQKLPILSFLIYLISHFWLLPIPFHIIGTPWRDRKVVSFAFLNYNGDIISWGFGSLTALLALHKTEIKCMSWNDKDLG